MELKWTVGLLSCFFVSQIGLSKNRLHARTSERNELYNDLGYDSDIVAFLLLPTPQNAMKIQYLNPSDLDQCSPRVKPMLFKTLKARRLNQPRP